MLVGRMQRFMDKTQIFVTCAKKTSEVPNLLHV
jgi:hypothetical protein